MQKRQSNKKLLGNANPYPSYGLPVGHSANANFIKKERSQTNNEEPLKTNNNNQTKKIYDQRKSSSKFLQELTRESRSRNNNLPLIRSTTTTIKEKPTNYLQFNSGGGGGKLITNTRSRNATTRDSLHQSSRSNNAELKQKKSKPINSNSSSIGRVTRTREGERLPTKLTASKVSLSLKGGKFEPEYETCTTRYQDYKSPMIKTSNFKKIERLFGGPKSPLMVSNAQIGDCAFAALDIKRFENCLKEKISNLFEKFKKDFDLNSFHVVVKLLEDGFDDEDRKILNEFYSKMIPESSASADGKILQKDDILKSQERIHHDDKVDDKNQVDDLLSNKISDNCIKETSENCQQIFVKERLSDMSVNHPIGVDSDAAMSVIKRSYEVVDQLIVENPDNKGNNDDLDSILKLIDSLLNLRIIKEEGYAIIEETPQLSATVECHSIQSGLSILSDCQIQNFNPNKLNQTYEKYSNERDEFIASIISSDYNPTAPETHSEFIDSFSRNTFYNPYRSSQPFNVPKIKRESLFMTPSLPQSQPPSSSSLSSQQTQSPSSPPPSPKIIFSLYSIETDNVINYGSYLDQEPSQSLNDQNNKNLTTKFKTTTTTTTSKLSQELQYMTKNGDGDREFFNWLNVTNQREGSDGSGGGGGVEEEELNETSSIAVCVDTMSIYQDEEFHAEQIEKKNLSRFSKYSKLFRLSRQRNRMRRNAKSFKTKTRRNSHFIKGNDATTTTTTTATTATTTIMGGCSLMFTHQDQDKIEQQQRITKKKFLYFLLHLTFVSLIFIGLLLVVPEISCIVDTINDEKEEY